MITVFYDGKCGLCAREIAYYRRIAPAGVFAWHDITESAELLHSAGISLAEGLKLLHVQDETGQLHIGVDAFIVIWKSLPRWRVLALLVALPVVRPLTNYVYRAFATWRFSRLEHCQLAAANDRP